MWSPKPTPKHLSTAAALALAVFGFGCASPRSNQPAVAPSIATSSAARVAVTETAQASQSAATADTADTAETAGTREVQRPEKLFTGETVIHSEVAADGVTTIAVPAIVREPLFQSAPAFVAPLYSESGGPYAVDAPKPARAAPKGRGFPVARSASLVAPVVQAAAGSRQVSSIRVVPPSPLAPSLVGDFDSLDFDDNAALTGFLFIPPDAHGAAGVNHVVAVTNVAVRFHGKTSGTVTFTDDLRDFFATLAPLTETFDPKVLYDPFADRFLIVTLEQTDVALGDAADTSRIFLAVSDDGDPNGKWTVTAIDSALALAPNSWADYPGFAVDEDAVYITANMFGFFSFGPSFTGVRLWIVDKGLGSGGFYDGNAATATLHDPYAGGGLAVTTQPAQVFCEPATTCPAPTGTYLVSYSGLTNDCRTDPTPLDCSDNSCGECCMSAQNLSASESLQIIRVDNPGIGATFTQEFLSTGNLEDLASCPELPDAPQKESGNTVEVNNRRALAAVWHDNKLFMAASINPKAGDPDAGETTAHWWHLDTTTPSNGTGAPETVLTDQGSISGEDITPDANPVSTFFPSIAVNAANEIAIGFSASSSTLFPGAYFTSRRPGDAAGSNSGSAELRAGLDSYHRIFSATQNRWGDYSAAAVDPQDQCFWVYNEYSLCITGLAPCSAVADANNGRWGTAFGKFCIDCAASPLTLSSPTTLPNTKFRAATITVTGTADVTAGDLTLEGQTIAFEDGFSAVGELSVFTGFCPL